MLLQSIIDVFFASTSFLPISAFYFTCHHVVRIIIIVVIVVIVLLSSSYCCCCCCHHRTIPITLLFNRVLSTTSVFSSFNASNSGLLPLASIICTIAENFLVSIRLSSSTSLSTLFRSDFLFFLFFNVCPVLIYYYDRYIFRKRPIVSLNPSLYRVVYTSLFLSLSLSLSLCVSYQIFLS